MPTFKAIVISNNRRQDGTFPVKIRVYHNGKNRRIATTLICKPSDLTRSLKIKNADILTRAESIIADMRGAIRDISPFELEREDVDWLVRKIKDTLAGESFHLDFFSWGYDYIQGKTPKTREAYTTALNTFARFVGEPSLDINAITRTMLLDFMQFVDGEKKLRWNPKTGEVEQTSVEKIPRGASTRHIMKLQHIFQAAKDRYNDEDTGRILIPRSPFDKIEKHFPHSQGQKALSLEQMQRVISAQVDSVPERVALDVFILSFGLMGANLADLYCATPFSGMWEYERTKTRTRRADKAEMKVAVPEQMLPYIARLQDGEGWWLGRLHTFSNNKDGVTKRVNRYLEQWCKKEGLPVFTFYAARHTWATLAVNKAGIDMAVVDRCLVHKDKIALAGTYVETDWGMLNDTNRKVLELLEW